MKAAGWMIAAAVASALTVVAVAGRQTVAEVLLGMLAPLAAAGVSWVLVERTYQRDPAQVTPVMIGAFGVKVLFFRGYTAVMLTVVGLRPVPFVASFTSYFIALYLAEALLMRRLFAGG